MKNLMNNFYNMEQNKHYVCGEHIVHRVNNELFADGQLLYTFHIHANMVDKYKDKYKNKTAILASFSPYCNMSPQQICSLIYIIEKGDFQQVQ